MSYQVHTKHNGDIIALLYLQQYSQDLANRLEVQVGTPTQRKILCV